MCSSDLGRVVHEHIKRDVLILAPLAVAGQTVKEAAAIGVTVTPCREPEDVRPGLNITNYDRLHKFDASRFGGVVCDESSIIKNFAGATLRQLMDAFRDTPYKLCCTATPAPNDWTELGNHAEFLGVCSRSEMLSEFFVHDGGETQTWRLKGHARGAFWRWVASWGALVAHPRDLGAEFDAAGYDLPALSLHEHLMPVHEDEARAAGVLFVEEAVGLMEQRTARRVSVGQRVAACAATVAREPREAWVVWCDLNVESEALTAAIPGAVEVTGSMDSDEKERRLVAWLDGETRVLVTKSSICGFGVNAQRCARVAFVGVTHSWEAYYQSVRRCWRFGQKRPVDVHIFASEAEGAVVANLNRKDRDATEMSRALAEETREALRSSVIRQKRYTNDYEPRTEMKIPAWLRTESA